MMRADPETRFPDDYRQARREFIDAAAQAGLGANSRLHPARGADGLPLFLDSVALGARDAARGLLLICGAGFGAALLTRLLREGLAPPPGARLVLVHARDPARFAGQDATDPQWPLDMLRAVAIEDLSRVRRLTVLDLDGAGEGQTEALAAALPQAVLTVGAPPPPDFAAAWAQMTLLLAGL